MANESTLLMTAGTMAKELGVSDAKVRKAITDLGLLPETKKGCCNYYTAESLKKVKAALR